MWYNKYVKGRDPETIKRKEEIPVEKFLELVKELTNLLEQVDKLLGRAVALVAVIQLLLETLT